MTPEEYAAQQLLITSAIARFVQQFGKFFARPGLSVKDWVGLLQLLFPEVQARRTESASLARTFYDSQRALHHPDLPRNDMFLEEFEFEEFVAEMEPVRLRVSQEDSPQDAIGALALRTMRSVENGGRRQIIHAVEDEPSSKVLRGWARVATGRETCAWCIMLISRGPVYLGADTAGLDLDDESAQRMIASGEDVSEYMEQWHTGCDCKVVPVFQRESWFGEDASKRALELWIDADKEATRLRKLDPDRRHTSGKNRGKKFTHNEDVINVLRRRLNSGEISTSEFAALNAA